MRKAFRTCERGQSMKLYHTSQTEIRIPDIHLGRKNADFGPGFYLTPDLDFAFRWGPEGAVINEYELDLSGLRVHSFRRTVEWFEYIYRNRRGTDTVSADLVDGPIANDTIFDTLGIISSGFLSAENALQLLLIGPEYRQIALKTEKAASQLRWIGMQKIPAKDQELLEKERMAYQKEFSEALGDITSR